MRFAYIGNFEPEHSTENHVRTALERVGHEVVALQENDASTWQRRPFWEHGRPDVILWTRTGWDWPSCTGWSWERACESQRAMLDGANNEHIPTVGLHLDRWWGLDRQGQVHDEPFFECDLVVTADGGHEQEWRDAGVNHAWLPPAVLLAECEREGRIEPGLARTPVVWVGSWRSYHAEWLPYRQALINALRRRYRRQLGLFPRGKSIRGAELSNLYASAKVVVGDSCLAGGATRYWSDRIPEVIGRGGFLVHPEVEGLEEHFTPGLHLETYPLGDFDALCSIIDRYLDDGPRRDGIRSAGREWVMEHHTYERRMGQLVQLLRTGGLL